MMKRASRILAILLFVAEYGWSAPAAGRPIHSVHSNGAARKKLPKSFDLKLSMQENGRQTFYILGSYCFSFQTDDDGRYTGGCRLQQPLDMCLVLDDRAGCEHPRQVDGNTANKSNHVQTQQLSANFLSLSFGVLPLTWNHSVMS
jgi:hypothetical protein